MREEPPPQRSEAHGGVSGKKTKSMRQAWAERSSWIIAPTVEWLEKNRTQLQIPEELNIAESYNALMGRSSV
jgi:hypothetical protein